MRQNQRAEGKNSYYIQVLDRAIKVLDCFSPKDTELGVTEISRKLGLHKSTTHRLLEALKSYGFIAQDAENEKYHLGLKLFELGSRAVARLDIRERARPVLEQLVAETGETAHLCVLDQGEVLYLEKVESQQTLRIPSRIGQKNPAHCTAVGKALLACLPEEELESLIRLKGLKRYTKNTIIIPGELKRELAAVRNRGFSVDNEEIEEGLKCIGAPVRDYTGKVVAAISIAGPAFRMTENKVESLARSVATAARTLSERMGYNRALNYNEAYK